MWIDDFVKKGIDKSLNFVKQVTQNDNQRVDVKPVPIPSQGGQYVTYRLREALADVHAPFPDGSLEEPDNMFWCAGNCVGDVLHAFPVPGNTFYFRFKKEDDLFGFVWVEGLDESEVCPVVDGRVVMDVLVCPVERVVRKEIKKEEVMATTAPNREDLIRQRQEREAAQVQAARDFAEASARAESERRQNKLDVQGSLGPELDKWAFTEPGKYKDVRSLLSSLESVLWPNSGWESIALGELMINESAVKKLHRKAIILCHPDRHQQATTEQQYRADRIFNAINEAYKLHAQK